LPALVANALLVSSDAFVLVTGVLLLGVDMTLLHKVSEQARTTLDTRTRQKFRTKRNSFQVQNAQAKRGPLVPLLTLLLLVITTLAALAALLLLVVTALPAALLLVALATLLLVALATLLLVALATLAGLAAAEAGLLLGVVLALLVAVEAGLLLGVQVLLVPAVLQLLRVHPDLVEQPGVLLRVNLIHPLQLLRSLLVVPAELTDQVQNLTDIEPHEHSFSRGPTQVCASQDMGVPLPCWATPWAGRCHRPVPQRLFRSTAALRPLLEVVVLLIVAAVLAPLLQ